MKTEYTRDAVKLTPDERVLELVRKSPGKPIKLRVQPMLFDRSSGASGQYRGWSEVSWTIECENAEEVFELREALRAFFAATTTHGAKTVIARLVDHAGPAEAA